MPILFLDESGFTGQDLLNTAQPVFALATISYPETAIIIALATTKLS